MAKITRKTAIQFGSSAGVNQIAQFGSLLAGSPTFSTDPAVIQALANWTQGWFSAVENVNSPAIEDMNAFCFVLAYQMAYQMQEGIPEWDSGTTYYIGSLVNNGSGVVYLSTTNANLNHAVTDPANWKKAFVTLDGTETLTNKTLTSPTITGESSTGGSIIGATFLSVQDSGTPAFNVTIRPQSSATLTANRLLILDMVDGNHTLSMNGNVTFNGSFLTTPGNAITLTSKGTTNVTLPTAGTLMPGTNWAAYTPTIVSFGTVTNNSAFWRRVGDSVQVKGYFTAGTTTAVANSISLPTGANTIDTTKLTLTKSPILGQLYRATSGGNNLPGTAAGVFAISFTSGDLTSVYTSLQAISSNNIFTISIGTGVAASGDNVTYSFEVPVTQFAF